MLRKLIRGVIILNIPIIAMVIAGLLAKVVTMDMIMNFIYIVIVLGVIYIAKEEFING